MSIIACVIAIAFPNLLFSPTKLANEPSAPVIAETFASAISLSLFFSAASDSALNLFNSFWASIKACVPTLKLSILVCKVFSISNLSSASISFNFSNLKTSLSINSAFANFVICATSWIPCAF